MRGRALDLLARLRRHEVDRRRLAAASLVGELQQVQKAIGAEGCRFASEVASAFELPGGPWPLASFAEASRHRSRALIERRRQIEVSLEAMQVELRDAIQRWQSLDAALDALHAAARSAAAGRTRQEIEEAALLRRAGAQNSGASVTSRPSSAGPNLIWQDSRELSRTS
ncbi:MAG: hypothetical protein AB7I59_24605 [Geminicoccaceae bacterium]